jgi:hypothetical protein
MKRISIYLFCVIYVFFVLFLGLYLARPSHICPSPSSLEITANPVKEFEGVVDSNLYNTQVFIPMKDRVFNKTGIQCVWSSVETLARYAEIEKLYDITEKDEYKSYAGPKSLKAMLNKYDIKYEMTTSKNNRSLLIKGCVVEKRAVGFDIPGHVMVLVHYDEVNGIVKYINNSDPTLKIRTWTIEEFNKRWDGWVFLIYADNDIIPYKNGGRFDVIDKNEYQSKYEKNYILSPIINFF